MHALTSPLPRPALRPALAAVLAGLISPACLLGLSACASPPPTAGRSEIAHAVGDGVIVSMRPQPAGAAIRGSILGALGGGAAVPEAGTMEFIVRRDSGETISIMQINELGLRPGERVALTQASVAGAARTRIAHASN